jgi:molecular chaperone DnaK
MKRSLGTDKRFEVGPLSLDAEDVCALYLRGVREYIERAPGSPPVTDALVSAPANFSTRQVDELLSAYARAGFVVRRVISEPCVAAMNLPAREGANELVLVIDLGGGTLDAAVVVLGENVYDVVSVAGDNALGGCDFDDAIVTLLREKVSSRLGSAAADGAWSRDHRLSFAVERAKIELSGSPTTTVFVEGLSRDDGSPLRFSVQVSREEFVQRAAHLTERVERCIQTALRNARPHHTAPLAAVMLAGRACDVWPVRELIARMFPHERIIDVWRESAVVWGLSRQAGILTGAVKTGLLLDVTRGIGILSAGVDEMGLIHIPSDPAAASTPALLVKPDTTIPTIKMETLLIPAGGWEGTLTFIEEDLIDRRHAVIGRIHIPHSPGPTLGIECHIDACHTIVVRVRDVAGKLLCESQLNNVLISLDPRRPRGSS